MTENETRSAGYDFPGRPYADGVDVTRNRALRGRGLVINADTDRILCAAILGSEGGDLVQTLMAEAPWMLFEKATFIHLTERFSV